MKFLFEPASGDGTGGGAGAPPAFTPSYEGALKPDGSFSEGWHTKALGADYNGPLATAKTLADVDKMLRDNIAAARAKTDGMVRVPGENATPEEIAAFHRALGVPDKPEDYKLPPPEKVPEGVVHDTKLEADFLAKSRELGLNAKQVQALRDWQMERVGATVAEQRAATAKSIEAEKAELQTRFGAKLETAVQEASALVNAKWVPEGFRKYLADGAADPASGNFAGADFLEFASAAARAAGEDRGAGGVRGGNTGFNVAEAKRVMSDPTHPDHAAWKAGDAQIHARIAQAYQNEVG